VVTAARVVGAAGSVVVVATGEGSTGSDPGSVYGIDVASKTVAWSRAAFTASGVIDGTVVGVASSGAGLLSQEIVGLSVADGKQTWTTTDNLLSTTVRATGPVVVATGQRYYDGVEFFRVINPTTGKVLDHSEGRGYATYRCRFDEKSTVVCGVENGPIYAFDPAAPQTVLWSLPDTATNRVAPRISTVWHGIVYTGVAFLDARTGKDKVQNPAVTPVVVNEYVGIALRDTANGSELIAAPATG
jgi:hypothetical protein